VVEQCPRGFCFVHADSLSVVEEGLSSVCTGTLRLKTRFGGSRRCPSGRLLLATAQSPGFTPGWRTCAYKTASGRREWPNRDPAGEAEDVNLYRFAYNNSVGFFDSDGFQVTTAPPAPSRPPGPTLLPRPGPGPGPKPGPPPTRPVMPPRLPVGGPGLGVLCLLFTPTSVGPEPTWTRGDPNFDYVPVTCTAISHTHDDPEQPGVCTFHCKGPPGSGIDFHVSTLSDDCKSYTYQAPVPKKT
jgi:hypothetical protein